MDLRGNESQPKTLVCPVCKNRYKQPKVLPCLHSCCYGCLKKLASFGHSFRCYVCMEEVDHRSISSLPDDFVARSLSDMLVVASFKKSGESINCTACESGSVALAKCQDCQDFLCKPCVNAHALTRLTKGHKICTFNAKDMNENDAAIFPDSRKIKCSTHTEDNVRYFCVSCEQAICSECLILKHRDHQLASIDEYGNKQRSKLAVSVMKAETKMKQIEEGLEHIRNLRDNVQLNAENAKSNVADHIVRCRKELDAIEEALQIEINNAVKKKHSSLQAQANDLEKILQKFKTACSFSANVLQSSNEAELMLLKHHIDSRLQTLDDINPVLEPRNDDVISYRYPEENLEKFGDRCFGEIVS